MNNLGWKLFNALFPRTLESFARRFAPLTLLAGLNGSGKSSVLQSLAAIRQSYQCGHENGFELGGPLIQLGQGMDVLSEGANEDIIIVEVIDAGVVYRWVSKVEKAGIN